MIASREEQPCVCSSGTAVEKEGQGRHPGWLAHAAQPNYIQYYTVSTSAHLNGWEVLWGWGDGGSQACKYWKSMGHELWIGIHLAICKYRTWNLRNENLQTQRDYCVYIYTRPSCFYVNPFLWFIYNSIPLGQFPLGICWTASNPQ